MKTFGIVLGLVGFYAMFLSVLLPSLALFVKPPVFWQKYRIAAIIYALLGTGFALFLVGLWLAN